MGGANEGIFNKNYPSEGDHRAVQHGSHIKPVRENVVVEWLSHAVMINAIEEVIGETPGDEHQFLQEWNPKGKGDRSAPGAEDGEKSPEEVSSAEMDHS